LSLVVVCVLLLRGVDHLVGPLLFTFSSGCVHTGFLYDILFVHGLCVFGIFEILINFLVQKISIVAASCGGDVVAAYWCSRDKGSAKHGFIGELASLVSPIFF
jgi:uncharacterized protein YqgC (DUF456 family)